MMLVDNFWHLYHNPIGPENWTGGDRSLLGGFGFQFQVGHRAPPLPSCIPLTPEGQLSHPLQDAVPSFAEYSLGDVVADGGDPAHLEALRRGEVQGAEALFPRVPALLWHRIMLEDGAQGRDMLPCDAVPPRRCRPLFVSMTDQSRARFCQQRSKYSDDLEPEVSCDGGRRRPPISYPYCNRETAPVAILSVDCLISESGYNGKVIIWNLVSLSAGGRVLAYNGAGRWKVPRGVPVSDHDELACAGTAVYPLAPGHFFNAILPRLVHMDATLPEHIPLLWPDGDLPARVLEEFRAAGLISARRAYVPTQSPRLHRARRMYTYASDYGPGHTPLNIMLGHATLQARILRHVAARAPAMHGGVVVLTRGRDGKARSVENQDELLRALAAALPGVAVDAFEPAGHMPFLEVAARVHPARLVMGPHGANLNNVFAARPGAAVVEFGFAGMPSEYFCVARNLGLEYWLVPSLAGGQGSRLRVSVPDVVDIARRVFSA